MGRTTKTFEERIQMMDQKEQEMSEKLRQYQAKRRQLEIAKKKEDELMESCRLCKVHYQKSWFY